MPDIVRDNEVQTVAIANGGTTSDPIDGRRYAAFGVILPATFTGTTLTFTSCDTLGGTYQAVYDQTGALVSIPVAQGRNYDIPAELVDWPYWRIVSGTAEGGARTLVVCAKT